MGVTISKIQQLFANSSLRKKILYIVLFSVSIISIASLTGIHVVSSAYLKLLKNTVSGNLSYSATTISYYLSNIETMSGMMLSDSNIQTNLTSVKHSSNPRTRTEAYKNLSYTVHEYYQQYKPNFINHVTLNNQDFATYTNFFSSQKTPEFIENQVLDKALEGDGRPVWVSDYGDEYGLYMGRLIKNIQSSNFEELGTLVVSVNLHKLIESLNQNNPLYEDANYSIVADGKIIYNKNEISYLIQDQLNTLEESEYNILSIQGHKYFVTTNTIPGMNWTYICYVSYDPIFRTVAFATTLSITMIFLSIFLAVIFSNSMISFIGRHTNHLVRKMQTFSDNENAVLDNSIDYSNRKDEFGVLNNQFDHMAEKIRELIRVNYINELWKKDAQLKALEMQINPHFLYNTLESVNWRAKTAGNMAISSMIQSLGTLLRATLSKTNSILEIKKELEIVSAYITIQKYRFEERLDYCISCDPALYNVTIPKMIIQPLVENSISYGLEESTFGIRIDVIIEHLKTDNILAIYVKNNGSAFEEGILEKLRSSQIQPHGFGIGLINIDERIKLMFGQEFGLTLYNEPGPPTEDFKEGNRAVAFIRIPYMADREEELSC